MKQPIVTLRPSAILLLAALAGWGCLEGEVSNPTDTASGDPTDTADGATEDTSDSGGDTADQDPDASADTADGTAADTAEAGTDADGAGEACATNADWLVDADAESTLVAPEASGDVTIDGTVDESTYRAVPGLEISDPNDNSDNAMTMQATWDADNLYVAVEVADASVESDSDDYPISEDSIEMFLDPVYDRGGEMGWDDYQIAIAADGAALVQRAGRQEIDWSHPFAVDSNDAGFAVELQIPWETLGLTPDTGLRFGFHLGNNDLDGGDKSLWSWNGLDSFKQPDQWGRLRLAGTDCEADVEVTDPPEMMSEHAIGGGDGYSETVSESEATEVVSTYAELESALGDASSGDLVYVADDAEIDMQSADDLQIPAGVTLGSGRGNDGSDGGLLYFDGQSNGGILAAGDDVRITGIRIRGPEVGFWEPPECEGRPCQTTGCGVAWDYNTKGVEVTGENVEIDNSVFKGWTYAAIDVGDTAPHVHHNRIVGNAMVGLGYGVVGCGGNPLIEYNFFDENRHSVAECGQGGYEARYNVHGENVVAHIFDQHDPGGTTTLIHHNTIRGTENVCGEDAVTASIRANPNDICEIHHNWLYMSSGEHFRGTNRSNVDVYDNHFGADEPSPDIGAPR